MEAAAAEGEARGRFRIPLWLRVLIGVALGAAAGAALGTRPWLFGWGNEDLGSLGLLVIRLMKALATPLILFAILDSFAHATISARSGGKFVLICLWNVTVAMTIGLLILNVFHPGDSWHGRIEQMRGAVEGSSALALAPKPASREAVSFDLLKNVAGYVPENVVDPFLKNNVVTIVLLGVLAGAALRKVRLRQTAGGSRAWEPAVRFVETGYLVLATVLGWVVELVPFAVFGVVAQVVGRSGIGIFSILWVFLVTMLAGLGIHALLYYPLAAWLWGRKTPREYLGKGADAMVTGLSCNSSLATIPVTLRCLRDMKVSEESARLSACVGTNLNNDGITLYEAMAALFLLQAFGHNLPLSAQLGVVLTALLTGVGIAGIPEAGLIILPLVLQRAGLPEAEAVVAFSLVVPVDWIVARARSGVNVMSDMLVAIMLDRGRPPTAGEVAAAEAEVGEMPAGPSGD